MFKAFIRKRKIRSALKHPRLSRKLIDRLESANNGWLSCDDVTNPENSVRAAESWVTDGRVRAAQSRCIEIVGGTYAYKLITCYEPDKDPWTGVAQVLVGDDCDLDWLRAQLKKAQFFWPNRNYLLLPGAARFTPEKTACQVAYKTH